MAKYTVESLQHICENLKVHNNLIGINEVLEEIIDYNELQLEKVKFDQNLAANLVTIEHQGTNVWNVLFDETLRDKVNPFEYYGTGSIINFIDCFIQLIKNNKPQ